ncbi:MAG: hypothetical protein HC851_25130 [Acaryochloris sp. RU_4_1]|nr:hypothetical protein [Acaryochloris sp. RU_4_1]
MAIESIVWIYWLCCLAATALMISNRTVVYGLLSPASELPYQDKGYPISLILGWLATLATSIAYVLFTRKYETGTYEIADLVAFSVSNGILEQFMFIFWFLLGCYIGKILVPNRPKFIFTSGYISYAIFSGLIHVLFWIQVLPAHKPVTVLMALLLSTMSLLWMWLVWRYRALLSIIAMHIVIDFLTIGHLNFHLV